MQEVETSRWGRRREWEDAPIRSSAPKVLSRLREATCQRQTLMRFLRGRVLINFMTKHVNIKGLQIQFSAVKKMPFYCLRWTGLSLHGGSAQLCSCQPTAQVHVLTSPKGSGQPRYLLSLSSKTPLEGRQIHRPGGNCRATLAPQVFLRQLLDPQFFLPAAILQTSSNSSREDTVLRHTILGDKFLTYSTALGTDSQFEKWCLQTWLPSKAVEITSA